MALRAGTTIEPGLVGRILSRLHVIAVASAQYLAEHGTPRRREDLAKHRCLLGFARGEVPQLYWPVGDANVHVEGMFFSNEIRLLAEAANQGLGIAYLPRTLVEDELARGTLVQVLPGVLEGESRIAIVYPERELVPPQVRAFVDAVVAWAPRIPALARIKPEPAKPAKQAKPARPRKHRAKA